MSEFLITWGTEVIAVIALLASIFAVRQTMNDGLCDLWVRAQTRFAEASLLLDEIDEWVPGLTKDWHAFHSAAENVQSEAHIKKNVDLDKIIADAAELRRRMPKLPDRRPRFSGNKLEKDLACLDDICAKALELVAGLDDERSKLRQGVMARQAAQMKETSRN